MNSNHAVQSSATPIIGAVALLNAWNEATQAVLWRKVRKRFEELRTAEVEAARNVKSAAEALEHFDEQQEVVCSGWKAVFNQFYARGRQNGTRKETLASVVRKSAAGGALPALLALFLLSLSCRWPPAPRLRWASAFSPTSIIAATTRTTTATWRKRIPISP